MDSALEYKCPDCGASLRFSSEAQDLKCDYCDNVFSIEQIREYQQILGNDGRIENNFEWENSESEFIPNTNIYICNSCGAEIESDENTMATECVYCGNPVVLSGNVRGMLKPDFVIPFKQTKEQAKAAFNNLCKGKKLLPKMFKEESRIDKITGLYVPFWLFSCNVNANVVYNATKKRSWRAGNYRYVETSHFIVTRDGRLAFDNVPVDGSSKMPDEYMDAIEPFDYNEMIDFKSMYLSGYFADKYDVNAENSKSRANERIRHSVETEFKKTVIGYSSVSTKSSIIDTSNGTVKYALLPVWVLNTKYKDKMYTFAMNGQTGKMIGNLPVDRGRYCKWLFGLTGVLSLLGSIAYLISIFLS